MIHILTGETLQVEKAYRRLRSEILPSLQEFNFDLIEGREATSLRILECCRLLPVLARSRMVVVRDADQIRPREQESLEPHLGEIPPSTELVFLADKLDRRTRFWQRVAEAGRWREFRPLNTPEILKWIETEVLGRPVPPEVFSWLVERFGRDLGPIVSTLEKAATLSGGGGKISLSDLEQSSETVPCKSLFELTDAVGSRKTERALRFFRQMISSESPVGILALLARHFRILHKVKETGEGAPLYFLKNYREMATLFSDEDLQQAMEMIFRTDWQLKSSRLPPEMLVERLIWNLCRA